MRVTHLKLSISNAYLVQDKQAILVDAGAPNDANKILAAVKQAGVDSKEISLILHTHGHIDHAGSTAELKRQLGVPVAVHPADAFMLNTGTSGEIKPRNLEARMVKSLIVKPFEPVAPDLLIKDEMSLADFGVDGNVIFTPGHTSGSISVLLANREAIVGDVVMGGWLGGNLFGTRPNYHYFIDDLSAVHTSLAKILAWDPAKIYVGHGGPLAPKAIRQHFPQAR